VGPDTLRAYRRNAVHVRQGLARLQEDAGRVQVDGGYLQNEGLIERYKQVSIPVRRALNPTDRASFAQALDTVQSETHVSDPAGSGDAVASAARAWSKLQTELDTIVGLGGGKVPRRQILAGWLDAAAFYDKLERDRAYDKLMDQWGKAAEGIGAQLMEDAARVIVDLDDVVADALGEPRILPPPVKTPPPPPDPKESFWKRWFGG
jgi:hypothetical protein